ncbi:MAG: UMP kinase, partial [Candidatus Yonathbacteria bacterium]|nr:UMP kinase [Candidatus Yonathbacteria bacterium]
MNKMKKTVVISLGGSLIVPDGGIDIGFLKKFRALILAHVRRGVRFVIITGGGTVCRDYQNALRDLGRRDATDLDWIGIRVSRLNAHLVRIMFGRRAPDRFITDATNVHPREYKKYPLLIAGGEKPGQSTDNVAVKLALFFGAHEIMNLSNIRYVYDR